MTDVNQNIIPNVDGAIQVDIVTNMWNMELAKNCKAIFSYSGPYTSEVQKIVSDIRARIQQMNTCIATILAELPE
jgi:uncharacterized lipoprotein YajG